MFLNIVSLVYRSTLYWHFYGFRRLWWNHLCCLQVILNHIWNKLARSYYLLEWFAFEQVMTWRSTALLKSQNKMNIQEKKRKMDLLIACSYMEVWVNFLSVSGHSGLFHGLYSIIRKLYVFLSKPWIEFLFSGLFLIEAEFFFFWGLDWSWLWTYQTVVLLLPSTLLSYWRYECLPSYSVYLPVCFNAVLLLANDTL